MAARAVCCYNRHSNRMAEDCGIFSLFAVHIMDGVLLPSFAAAGWLVAIGMVMLAAWRLPEEEVPRLSLFTAVFFVSSSIHIRLGPASAHLLLGGLIGIVLGRRATLAIFVGLILQAALLGHGGWTSMGVNTVIIAVPAVLSGLLFSLLIRQFQRYAIAIGAVAGCASVVATAGLCFAALRFGGEPGVEVLGGLILGSHLPIAVVEGIVTGIVAGTLSRVRPDWLGIQGVSGNSSSNGTSH